MPLDAGAGASDARRHAFVKSVRSLGGNILLHHAEAHAGKRQVAGRSHHVLQRDGEHVVDGDPLGIFQPVDQDIEEAGAVALVQREQQLFLAGKIKVDRALGEPGKIGDFGDVREAIRKADEKPLGRVENRVAPLFLVLGLNGPLPDDHTTPYAND